MDLNFRMSLGFLDWGTEWTEVLFIHPSLSLAQAVLMAPQ